MVTAGVFLAEGQSCNLRWEASLYGAGATSEALPFWAVTGKNGVFPDSRSAFIVAGTELVYDDQKKKFNNKRANLLIEPEYRKPWKFPKL